MTIYEAEDIWASVEYGRGDAKNYDFVKWEDHKKEVEKLRVALSDAISAFNNEEGKTTIVNEERLEAWERAIDV